MEASDQPNRKEGSVPTDYEDQWASGQVSLEVSEKRKNYCLEKI